MNEFKEIVPIFVADCEEQLEQFSNSLVSYEQDPTQHHLFDRMYRNLHTLKGNAGTFGNGFQKTDDTAKLLSLLSTLQHTCHHLEDPLTAAQEEKRPLTKEEIDTLFDGSNEIERLFSLILSSLDLNEADNRPVGQTFHLVVREEIPLRFAKTAMFLRSIEQKFASSLFSFSPSFKDLENEVPFDIISLTFSVEITDHDVSLFCDREKDLIISYEKLANDSKLDADSPQTAIEKGKSTEHQTMKVNVDKINEMFKHVSNLFILEHALSSFVETVKNKKERNPKELYRISDRLSRSVRDLHDSMMGVRMVPLAQLFNKFPLDIRTISHELGKDVLFKTNGSETEIDKSILDELYTPLLHILRNSVSHGIETKEERTLAGKPMQGSITLTASHKQGTVELVIADDGKGIQTERVVEKAIEKGLVTTEQAAMMSHQEKCGLIFHPGLSTASVVNQYSGRGVGMDAVNETMKSLKGKIEVNSEPGLGTSVVLKLPLTLATIDSLTGSYGGERYAIPMSQIVEVLDYNEHIRVKNISGTKTFFFRGNEIPLYELSDIFPIPTSYASTDRSILVVQSGNIHFSLVLDECNTRRMLVMRPLGNYLGTMPGISGCSVEGDGSLLLILDLNSILSMINQH